MTESKRHFCRDCKGTGRIVTVQTRIIHGVKKNYDVLVDCPGLIADQFDTRRLATGGQDRAAGEKGDADA